MVGSERTSGADTVDRSVLKRRPRHHYEIEQAYLTLDAMKSFEESAKRIAGYAASVSFGFSGSMVSLLLTAIHRESGMGMVVKPQEKMPWHMVTGNR